MRETMQTALGARARRWLVPALVAGLLGAPGVASAAVYSYVEWSAADVANGTASGLITLPDQSTVKVSFAARTATGAPGTLYGAQINGQGTNYWTPSAPYISSEVENPPPDADILRLSGGNDDIYTVTLSEPRYATYVAILAKPGDSDSHFAWEAAIIAARRSMRPPLSSWTCMTSPDSSL